MRARIQHIAYAIVLGTLFFLLISGPTHTTGILLIYLAIAFSSSFLYVYSLGVRTHIFAYSLSMAIITLLAMGAIVLLVSLEGHTSLFINIFLPSSLFIIGYLFLLLVLYLSFVQSGYVSSSVADDVLTSRFSGLRELTGMKFRILVTDKNESVNLFLDRKSGVLDIFFNRLFLSGLEELEVRAAILHEIGHVRGVSRFRTPLIIPFFFYAYFTGYVYFIATSGYGGLHTLLSIPVLIAMLVSFFVLIRKLPEFLESREFGADKYAVKVLGESDNLVSLLTKVQEHNAILPEYSDGLIRNISEKHLLERKDRLTGERGKK